MHSYKPADNIILRAHLQKPKYIKYPEINLTKHIQDFHNKITKLY